MPTPPVFPDAPARAPGRSGVERAAQPARGAAAKGARAPKGRQTRAAILDAALGLASQMGLEGLSIGALAEVTQMSKSGVFAHFGSREELQISVVHEYHARFEQEVFFPAMNEPRGLPRLHALFEHWVRRVSVELDSGCIYISGAVDFDDRPGPVRDALATMVRAWHAALERAIRLAVDAGQLRADTDTEQMLFEIHGLILALHHDARFLRNPGVLDRARRGFERLLAHYRPVDAAAATAASPTPTPAPAPAPPAPTPALRARRAVRTAAR
ncbi:MAG: TetR/AcrR family transcriptional regulator [Burkholderiales bacterium]|nr:TetR/AcrR family transcriptional regulator [Burkholderiales bacterium]